MVATLVDVLCFVVVSVSKFFQKAEPSSISLVAITLTIVNTDKIVSIAMHQTDTDCPSFIIMLVELRNR